ARASPIFPAVEHHVVRFGQRLTWITVQIVFVTIHGCGKWMMQRVPALLVVIPLEHGAIEHPQGSPPRLHEALLMPHLCAKRSERLVDYLGSIGPKEDEVAV